MLDEQQQVRFGETACPVSFDAQVVPAAGDLIAMLGYELDEIVPVFGNDWGGLRIVLRVIHVGEPLCILAGPPLTSSSWERRHRGCKPGCRHLACSLVTGREEAGNDACAPRTLPGYRFSIIAEANSLVFNFVAPSIWR